MKHNEFFTFNYPVVKYNSFTIDLNELADLLIANYSESESDIEGIKIYFGDNIEYYLNKLGFPKEATTDEDFDDYIWNSIIEDLDYILSKKL